MGLLATGAPPALVAGDSTFHDAEQWCAVGDSITYGGTYHQWIRLFYLTRFPAHSLGFSNGGIGGDTAEKVLKRMAWDITPHHPTVATVMLGMNDVARDLYAMPEPTAEVIARRRERLAAYEANLRKLVEHLKADGARVILLTPSIFDETAKIDAPPAYGVDAALAECARRVAAIAQEYDCACVDFHQPMARLNAALHVANPSYTLVGRDRIHPGIEGHFMMAYLFLRGQGASGIVSKLVLDAATAKPVAAENGTLAEIHAADSSRTLAFIWAEHALPFPIEVAGDAASLVPFNDELNQEILCIRNLPAGQYRLSIDQIDVATWSNEQLAAGVNLASIARTPQQVQARKVFAVLHESTTYEGQTLRRLALIEAQSGATVPHPVTLGQMEPWLAKMRADSDLLARSAATKAALASYPANKPKEAEFVAHLAEFEKQLQPLRQPVPHQFVLTRVE